MTEKLEIMKLKEVRLMNTLDGEKELVWKLNVDRYTKQLRSELEEAKKTIREYKEYNFNTNNKLKEKKNQVIIYIDDEKTDKIIKMFKEISRGEE